MSKSRNRCKGVHLMMITIKRDGRSEPSCIWCGLYPNEIKKRNEIMDWKFGYWRRDKVK